MFSLRRIAPPNGYHTAFDDVSKSRYNYYLFYNDLFKQQRVLERYAYYEQLNHSNQ